jgi:DNA-binding transcriptional ArsR family regulator
MPDVVEVDSAAAVLRALATPVRLAVLVELRAGPRCVHELVAALYDAGRPASQPLVSQHLRVLRRTGLVTSARRGQEVVYALTDERARAIIDSVLP